MPAFISGAIRCFSNRFGPIVQTIFVLRIGAFMKTFPHFHRILSYYIIQILCCESPAIKIVKNRTQKRTKAAASAR